MVISSSYEGNVVIHIDFHVLMQRNMVRMNNG